jgi:hypothetical protein
METQYSLLGKIEKNLVESMATVDKIGRLKISDYEVNRLKTNLRIIQGLLYAVATCDKRGPEPEPEPEPKNEAREALKTGDWGSFFDSLTKLN